MMIRLYPREIGKRSGENGSFRAPLDAGDCKMALIHLEIPSVSAADPGILA